MITKLTLTIEEKTIKKAKILSRRKGKSLSKMVEEYLDSITDVDDKKGSVVYRLRGALKGKAPADVNWKDVKKKYLKKKHGL